MTNENQKASMASQIFCDGIKYGLVKGYFDARDLAKWSQATKADVMEWVDGSDSVDAVTIARTVKGMRSRMERIGNIASIIEKALS